LHVTVITDTITVDTLSITVTGTVDIGEDVTLIEKGFVYSKTDSTPTIAEGATKVVSTDMSETVIGLDESSTYYFRAYANTSEGLVYGNVLNDTTGSLDYDFSIKDFMTLNETIGLTSFDISMNITKGTDLTISEYGFCYSSSNTTPTVSNSKKTSTDSLTDIVETITGLSNNTTYYVRGYAITNDGTYIKLK